MPPRHIPLHPSAPGCCWEPSHHLQLQKQQLQLITCRHSQLLILAAIWLHFTYIPAMKSKRVFYLLPPIAEGWTKKQARLIWNRRQIINKQEAERRVLSDTSMQTKGELPSRSNNWEFAFPEDPFWATLHELSVIHFVCFPLVFLLSSFLFISISLLQALSANKNNKSDL